MKHKELCVVCATYATHRVIEPTGEGATPVCADHATTARRLGYVVRHENDHQVRAS